MLHAELYEGGDLVYFGTAPVSAIQDLPGFDPMRDLLSAMFTMLVYCGYALGLVELMSIAQERGAFITPTNGMIWSVAGWNLKLNVTNFAFSSQNASLDHVSGEGHTNSHQELAVHGVPARVSVPVRDQVSDAVQKTRRGPIAPFKSAGRVRRLGRDIVWRRAYHHIFAALGLGVFNTPRNERFANPHAAQTFTHKHVVNVISTRTELQLRQG